MAPKTTNAKTRTNTCQEIHADKLSPGKSNGMAMHLITLNRPGHILAASAMGSSSSLRMAMNRRHAAEARVRVESSSEKKHATPTVTKSSKQISVAFFTCTTILSPPRDPVSTSDGFGRDGGSYDLLMDPFTGMDALEFPEPLRPARTMISVGASACIACREYRRGLKIVQKMGENAH